MNGRKMKKNRKSFYLVLALLLCIQSAMLVHDTAKTAETEAENSTENTEAAQSEGGGAAVTNQLEGMGYATELYDSSNGLPISGANAILSTSDGFIWIGGYSGLYRYDGTSFEYLDSSGGITNANTLFEDSKGRLWVGTNDNGVVVLDNGESRHYTYEDELPTSTIRSIAEDAEGNILIGTTQGVSYVDEAMELHYLDEPQLNNVYISRLIANSEGLVFGCTRDGAAFCISDLRVSGYYNGDELGVSKVTAIYPDPQKPSAVYLGNASGMVYHGSIDDNFKTLKKLPTSMDSRITWIMYASDRLWALSDVGVGYFDSNQDYQTLHNISLNSGIGSMIEDYEGNLWISSDRQGVMKIVANKFTNITEHAALEASVVNSTCKHNGDLYIGTDIGLQILDEDDQEIQNDLTEYIGDSRIRCLMEDQQGNLWISTYTNGLGLVCYTAKGKIKGYTEKNGLLSNEIRCTIQASDGSILAATNGGLAIILDGKIVRTIGADSGVGNTVFLTVEEGENGTYYVGTDGNGIYVIDDKNIVRLGREDGLTSDVILRIKKDEKRGVYWIITSNSIEYLKDGAITAVEHFPYTNNYDIYFDDNENAWILASSGIYVVNAQEMLGQEKFDYLFYDTSSGLPSLPTGNSFSGLDEDGTIYIAARSGVISVNMNHYFEQTHDIRLSIPYIEADGVRYFPNRNNTITIPASSKVVTIYGYALTYSMQNPTIQYFLDGIDGSSTLVSKKDMEPVRYTNLAGGEYEYQLSLVNTSTHNIQQTNSITIIKTKAFYEKTWFYVLAIILIILLILFIVQMYIGRKTRALMKKDEENKTFIREMIRAFAKTIDMKDKYTNGHSARVAKYTAMLTRELGYDEETVDNYYNIALLHDIGKIGVPAAVLNKPGKLTDEEFQIIKSHSPLGYNVLKDISIMPELAIGAGAHHERPDGKGYPNGLKGNEIPRVAQIIAVADTFDAMYSDRPYRKRMKFEKAVSIIKEVSGTQLTSDVVDAFLRLVDRGEFRDPKDTGGGTTEDIDNIHKKFNEKME